jgi:hypothetical protein
VGVCVCVCVCVCVGCEEQAERGQGEGTIRVGRPCAALWRRGDVGVHPHGAAWE